MNLDKLIAETLLNIKCYEELLDEEKIKLDAYYIARDAKADNYCGYTDHGERKLLERNGENPDGEHERPTPTYPQKK